MYQNILLPMKKLLFREYYGIVCPQEKMISHDTCCTDKLQCLSIAYLPKYDTGMITKQNKKIAESMCSPNACCL